MKRFLAFVFALLLFVPSVSASQVIDLPEDGGAYYTSVFVDANDSGTIASWFQSNSTLARLRNQTHFNVVATNDPQWASRYASAVPVRPCVAITRADGTVVFKASGQNVPNTANGLVSAIRGTIKPQASASDCCDAEKCNGACNGQCGKRSCKCKPRPNPVAPVVEPIKDTVPDLLGGSDEGPHFPFWLAAMLAVGGAGCALGPQVAKKVKALK